MPVDDPSKPNRSDATDRWRPYLLPALILAALAGFWVFTSVDGADTEKLTYSQFLEDVRGGEVASVTIGPDGTVTGETTGEAPFTTTIPTALDTGDVTTLLEDNDVDIDARGPSGGFGSFLVGMLPFILLIGFFVWASRRAAGQRMGAMQKLGSTRAKRITKERPDVTFDDVAGYESAKREIREVVDYLQDPSKYRKLGAEGPRGILLAGPPGTGKTLMARAVAGEAGVPFFSAAGSEFVEMIVGVGASRVRDLFEKARKAAPSIIFVDELDSIGRKRASGFNIGSHGEQEQTLNQLLAEMDGFDQSSGVVVMAASNRAQLLDEALLRPGRFDRQLEVGLPIQQERLEILRLHTRGKPIDDSVDLSLVARATPGFSGAELKNLVNEAAMRTARRDGEVITAEDLDRARDRLMLGQRRDSSILRDDDRERVAVHEAGHAIVAAAQDEADSVNKVTIVPTGQALGATHQLPEDDQRLTTHEWMRASLSVRMGGRVAEREVLEGLSSGAAQDLASATSLARRMVKDLGFSDRLGPVGYYDPRESDPQSRPFNDPFSDETKRVIDEEIARVLTEAEDLATSILSKYRDALDDLVQRLLDDDTVPGADVYELVGRPVPADLAGVSDGTADEVSGQAEE